MKLESLNSNPREQQIKACLIEFLRLKQKIFDNTSIINEFSVDKHNRRADLVLVDQTQFTAFEIKSDADRLTRLHGQVETYKQYFDKVILVVGPKYVDEVLKSTPADIGVWTYYKSTFKILRQGRKETRLPKDSYIGLMHVSELRQIVPKEESTTETKYRSQLENLARKLSRHELRESAIDFIKKRYAETTKHFWTTVGSAAVTPESLTKLSAVSLEQPDTLNDRNSSKLWDEWEHHVRFEPDDRHLAQWAREAGNMPFGAITEP